MKDTLQVVVVDSDMREILNLGATLQAVKKINKAFTVQPDLSKDSIPQNPPKKPLHRIKV